MRIKADYRISTLMNLLTKGQNIHQVGPDKNRINKKQEEFLTVKRKNNKADNYYHYDGA